MIASFDVLDNVCSSTAPQLYKNLPAREDFPESTGPIIARFTNGVLLSHLFVREDGSLGDISVDAEGGREGKMLLSVLTDGDLDLPLEQASNCISWKPSMLLGFRIVFESNFLPLALSVASLVPLVPRDIAEDDPDFIILSTASPVKINNH